MKNKMQLLERDIERLKEIWEEISVHTKRVAVARLGMDYFKLLVDMKEDKPQEMEVIQVKLTQLRESLLSLN